MAFDVYGLFAGASGYMGAVIFLLVPFLFGGIFILAYKKGMFARFTSREKMLVFMPRAGGGIDNRVETIHSVQRGQSQNYKSAVTGVEFAADQDEIWTGLYKFVRFLKDGRYHPVNFINNVLVSQYSPIQDQIFNESVVEALAKTEERKGFIEQNKELISLLIFVVGVAVVMNIWVQHLVEIENQVLAIYSEAMSKLETRPVMVYPQSNFTGITTSPISQTLPRVNGT